MLLFCFLLSLLSLHVSSSWFISLIAYLVLSSSLSPFYPPFLGLIFLSSPFTSHPHHLVPHSCPFPHCFIATSLSSCSSASPLRRTTNLHPSLWRGGSHTNTCSRGIRKRVKSLCKRDTPRFSWPSIISLKEYRPGKMMINKLCSSEEKCLPCDIKHSGNEAK